MLHANAHAQFGGASVGVPSTGPGPLACGSGRWRGRRSAGFTMVELLVVIAVLALLIGLVSAVAGKAIRQQKIRNTQQIMQNTMLALEQFATENPLGAAYDRKGRQTFGKYPPYQLHNYAAASSVATMLEPVNPGGNNLLSERLWRDLGNSQDNITDWVRIGSEDAPPPVGYPDGHDDNRALCAYLKLFSPESINLIPEDRLRPIYPSARDYANPIGPTGTGGTPGTAGATDWVDILGIHDAWGVPLDYMLYVKCEWRLPSGGSAPSFVVTERRPVLRSRGIKREVYDTVVESDGSFSSYDDHVLFSEDLPKPWFGGSSSQLGNGGTYGFTGSANSGWIRAVALADDDDYAYRPDDQPPP